MEFNVLPRAKILSPQSKHKSSQTTNQTVNVILPQTQPQPKSENPPQPPEPSNPGVSTSSREFETEKPMYPIHEPGESEIQYDTNPYKSLQPGEVQYQSRDVNLEEPAEKLSKEDSLATINFLKLVVQAYMSNPIKYNGYVICSVPVLENLIETLTSCENCDIEITDIEAGCCGASSNHIVPINKIWVRSGDTNEIFKYKYSQFLQTFEQYNISLKFAYVE